MKSHDTPPDRSGGPQEEIDSAFESITNNELHDLNNPHQSDYDTHPRPSPIPEGMPPGHIAIKGDFPKPEDTPLKKS